MRDLPTPDQKAAAITDAPFVEIRNLGVTFVGDDETVQAVNGVSLSVQRGKVLCIIGESGSGKSAMMRALMRLHPKKRTRISGSIQVGPHDIGALSERRMQDLRGSEIAMIFQEPMTALDPLYTIGDQIIETVIQHEGLSRRAARQRALELLEMVRVPSPERRLRAFPHELSGGLRQRAMIAVALSCRPNLLLADEPTTALDASVQIQILVLLRRLQAELGMSVLLVTHDLGVAAQIADQVAVMYAGRVVEYGTIHDILTRPQHPYTRGMLSSTVEGQASGAPLDAIPGAPPDLRALPPGCSFAPRCAFATPECTATDPAEVTDKTGHMARCHHVSVSGHRLFLDPASQVPDHRGSET